MKHILFLAVCISFYSLKSQDFSQINADLNISDSLEYNTEIRIYQSVSPTNYHSLLRLYKNDWGEWTAEFLEHWRKVEGVVEMKTKSRKLRSKSEIEYVYLNLFRSYIFELPREEDIRWKLQERGEIKYFDRHVRGTKTKELDIIIKSAMQLDGIHYFFNVQNPNQTNNFDFGDPKWHIARYPEIDEPKYVQEILEIVREEFDIWNK